MRVVVAMSGGVDSSTAAGLLVEQGHEVIGLAMKTHGAHQSKPHGCCTPEDLQDARNMADHLNIPFYVLNYTDIFFREIIEPFARAYAAGMTPNPCVICNSEIKFKPLLSSAKLLGAEKLATGHYARISDGDTGPVLRRGSDARKDQSYFLYRLDQEQLSAVTFPLGDMTKDVVRGEARRLGLEVAEKGESQELCFVGPEGYAAAVEAVVGPIGKPGHIVDATGRVLGDHPGVHHFTLGQRRGLGISSAESLYVTGIDASLAQVRVGPQTDLLTESITIDNPHWISSPPPDEEVVWVQQRYREQPHQARVVQNSGENAKIVFVEPTLRSAPGQAVVVYRNDQVLGGGVLAR